MKMKPIYGPPTVKAMEYRRQRDELLEALEALIWHVDASENTAVTLLDEWIEDCNKARAVIAKVKK